jgi:HAD superfamily hydrolase (TIGR01490 family)
VNASSRIAAFFDLDGTLIPFPTLERRLVRALLYRHAIPLRSLLLWPLEMLRLSQRGFVYARQANKLHLRAISPERVANLSQHLADAVHLEFFPQALDRLSWHASEGHTIVLVTGTLLPLARCVALALERGLLRRDIEATIFVRATILEEVSGRCTGRVVGEPMFGRAKAAAVEALASLSNLNLSESYAYGDCLHDCPMLECVGHPRVVNPSKSLRRVAEQNGWRILGWHLLLSDRHRSVRSNLRFSKRKVETLG